MPVVPAPRLVESPGANGSIVLHRLIQWTGKDGRPRSAYVHPDKNLGDPEWWRGKIITQSFLG